MKMTVDEKAREYRRVAGEILDYAWNCADKGMVPLKHDLNIYLDRLNQVRAARVRR